MKKGKLLALLLCLAMAVSLLAGCGSSSSSDSDTEDASADTEETEAEDASGDTADADYSSVDAVEFTFTTTYQQTETGGIIIQYFIDYLSDITDGQITVSATWGGTLTDDSGMLDLVRSGGVDMCMLSHMQHLDTLNYMSFPGFAPGSSQNALDYFDYIMFDNEETATLIQEEAAEENIKYLNVTAGGVNAYCATYEFTDLDSLISNGSDFSNGDSTIFVSLGFQVTSAGTPDELYDMLSRGQADCTQMALSPMTTMSWYEVADYWAIDGTYAAGNMFTVNLDFWDSLTEDQQAAIQAAADAVEEYSRTMYDESEAEDMQTIVDYTGNEFIEFSDEDIDRIWAASFEAKADAAMETAEANDKVEGMITILEAAAEFTGYDWVAPE